jgi:transcriptional/translational regulatory protein YebC/TACO1
MDEDNKVLNQYVIEAYGAGRVAMLIQCQTEDINTLKGEFNRVLTEYRSQFIDSGEVLQIFDKTGIIVVLRSEIVDKELGWPFFFEGIKRQERHQDYHRFRCRPETLDKLQQFFSSKNIEIQSAKIEYIPQTCRLKSRISESDMEYFQRLMNYLKSQDFILKIWTNLED